MVDIIIELVTFVLKRQKFKWIHLSFESWGIIATRNAWNVAFDFRAHTGPGVNHDASLSHFWPTPATGMSRVGRNMVNILDISWGTAEGQQAELSIQRG